MEKRTHTGKVPRFDPQLHLFETNSQEKNFEERKQTDQEERDSIGLKYNIYGDARKRMIKKDGIWSLDGQTVEEYSAMMSRIDEAPDKDETKRTPYAN